MKRCQILLCSFLVVNGMPITAQNIPPMIGTQVGRPKISVPNVMGQAQTEKGYEAAQRAATANAEKELLGVLTNWQSQFSKKDLESLASFYLQSPELLVYWNGREFSGWESVRPELERQLATPEGFQLELKNPRIQVLGRFAWVTSGYERNYWAEGHPTKQEGNLTLILERRRTAWIILHQHASAISGTNSMTISSQ
jgi:ketosteroid isomerase-like protein